MKEEWRDVVGYEGLYEVSNLGRLKRKKRTVINRCATYVINDRILKPYLDHYGYVVTSLKNEDGYKYKKMHRLIAEAFIPNNLNKPFINHKNGVKNDNRLDNIEWVTLQENMKHAAEIGLIETKNVNLITIERIDDYLIRKMSMLEICKKYNISRDALRKYFKKNNVVFRTLSEIHTLHPQNERDSKGRFLKKEDSDETV